jgi:hypothetical protein
MKCVCVFTDLWVCVKLPGYNTVVDNSLNIQSEIVLLALLGMPADVNLC